MRTRQKRKTLFRHLLVPAITLPCLAYFVSHAQSGRYGVEAGLAMKADFNSKTRLLAELELQRGDLEQRVRLLSDGTLERDMIDERARSSLNLANEDEIIILQR